VEAVKQGREYADKAGRGLSLSRADAPLRRKILDMQSGNRYRSVTVQQAISASRRVRMKLRRWMTVKDVLRVNAFKWPNKVGAKDLNKACTFSEWNERSCRLANALADLGMKKGDRFAVLAYNCVEWMDFYAAAAKGGFVCVPLMFRLAAPEMEYIVNHCEAKVFIVQDEWVKHVDGMRKNIPGVANYISFAVDRPTFDGYLAYEDLLLRASAEEPDTQVDADDLWVIMYTGGTTGKPKGVMKTHASLFAQYFISIFDHEFDFDDVNLLVMPCCHVNSLFYSFVATWVGGTVMAYNMVSFNPEDLLKTFAEHKVTFTSLVPTHYIMMLALPDEVKKKYDVTSVKKLLISSAPARRDTKLGILEMFRALLPS
jgi:fatty-acyl-CoA synthase